MYQNYHRHSSVSNFILADSVASNEDYCKRAKELGHSIISSCEHGTQGRWHECHELAKKYGLKWRYVCEAYFVKDRLAEDEEGRRDRTNAHIILAAKTRKGIGDLNEILSEANISGYYFRPRVDMELLLSLDPKDVFVTTACVGGVWQYGITKETDDDGNKHVRYHWSDADDLVLRLYRHFGNSMMLEVQYHHTPLQKEVNAHALSLYRKYGIPLIAGMDSHYIYPEEKILRDMRLEANNIIYDNEDGWFMDYPSDEEAFHRFEVQGVFPPALIREALDNTNVFLSFEDVELDKGKKLPTLYPDLSQEERNKKYADLVWDKWNQYKRDVLPEAYPAYEAGIRYEVDTITSTNTSDYFLLDYRWVERAKELGGVLTKTGRGSGPSYFTNTLLGFSSIDRFAIPITMYPDRFISADRLKAGSMPDLDLNVGNQDVFAQALTDVLGEWHSAPMVAFGTMKRLSAWKMYCRANDIPFEIANKLGDGLKAYELDYKHADEDEKDEIDVFSYIPKEYHEYLRQSEKYLGMVDSISPHPCAYLICNADIRREVGIYRINSKSGKKKTVYAAFIDGATADAFGYLKNDNLAVDVVKVNADIYRRIGIPQPSVPELLSMVEGDVSTWELYQKGYTLGLNQAEKEKSTEKAMRYSPKNISELSAFVAGIRPGFQSMAPKLFNREKFSYGIEALDLMLQTKEMRNSFILYQEQVMMIMQWAGFEPSESYAAIKAIAKKHPEKVLPMKERFLAGFTGRLISESGLSDKEASETSAMVWKIVEDNTGYSFNSSHSVAVALDSLYTAWAKAHHPYETYVALLSNYAEKKDKDRIARAKEEMKKAFGIRIVPCKFRQDNRSFFVDKEKQTISDALSSVKGISAKVAATLYAMRNNAYASAVDLFFDLEVNTAINCSVVETLIRMDYFSEFGSPGKLMALYKEFKEGKSKFSKNHVAATQQKRLCALREIEKNLPEKSLPMAEQLRFEIDYLGIPMSVYPEAKGSYAVIEVDDKYTPKLKMYNVATGTFGVMKIKKKMFSEKKVEPGSVIELLGWGRKPSYQYVDGKSVQKPGVFDLWITDYMIAGA